MRIAATRALPGPAWDELDDVVVGERANAEILILMNEPIAFGSYPDLRLVANFSVGYDNIDVAECKRRGIAVTNTPGVLDAATADPIRPCPTIAIVAPVTSRPRPGSLHPPAWMARSPSTIRRRAASRRPNVRSAVAASRTPGVFVTAIPRRLHSATSMLS